ncbi:MAG: DUF255 domain-containing protein [Dehalococcoidia bacterium]|nr:DUF255 domain-containing protein [Dehalococcoidia bacterium]
MVQSTPPRHTNRLIHETSPYLLQHAHNPVDWYPWGPEALKRAQAEDKPLLVSIGYSACHWCHVMERESFEDEAIAALMNEHFVCIKVDREERPDLDQIYMAATTALNQGQGGWPMTVFLTPQQTPFYAGTYFPPEDGHGRPGFPTLLRRLAELWKSERPNLEGAAADLARRLQQQAHGSARLAVGERELRLATEQFAETFDPIYGGFGRAPKFPAATGLSLLLRCHRRSGDARILDMVRKTLDGMARGGMYDQIGGGFARYSTDERWLVPHFEKMLYDNALLAKVYLDGWQATGNRLYRRIAAETLDYVLREMTSPEGGFYSATDADSEGHEGRFFVWSPAQLRPVLGEDGARWFCAYYDITPTGNWEGWNIPNTPRKLEDVARELGCPPQDLQQSLDQARPKVYEARRQRVPPATDDKVLTAWNGMMIGALAEGYRVLGEPRYLEGAERAADFILSRLASPDGRLLRTYRAGVAHLDAYLEDYACLAEGLLDLYEAGGRRRYLDQATRLAELILADFKDADGAAFYETARGHEPLIVRPREGQDGATPSANAVAAHVLARLSCHLGLPELRSAAIAAIREYGRMIAQYPRAFAKSLIVVDFLLDGPVELALVGRLQEPGFEALRRELGVHYLPNRIQALHDPSAGQAQGLPLLEGKALMGGRAALYVCRDFACAAPVTEAVQVAAALSAERGSRPSGPITLIDQLTAGHATPEGTAAYAQRFSAMRPYGYGPLGSTGLAISRLGFGGYRIEAETPEHRQALELALLSGCNLIDTSTNYTDGGSERLVGEALASLTRAGKLRREEVVVVSKVGYVQGENLELAQSREAAGRPFPEMVKYMEGCWHCVHPDFLQDQLTRSLERLQLEALDVCLLHNPEYYLSDAAHRGAGPLDKVRDDFYRRLQDAFAFFEEQVSAGKLRWYGVSSNTAVSPAGDPEATSLTRMLEAARRAGGDAHHFRVLQIPMNLLESGGATEPNNGLDGRQTALALALAQNLGVLVNRPLNAIHGPGMLRLADAPVARGEVSFITQIPAVGRLEEEFRGQLAPQIRAAPNTLAPAQYFRWAEQLQGLVPRLQGREHWEQIEAQIVGRTLQLAEGLGEHLTGPLGQRWAAWWERYLPELQKLLGAFRYVAASKGQEQAAAVASVLDLALPEERRREGLSRKALWVLASTSGVSCVLNGMRRPAYVSDALGVLAWSPLPDALPVYSALRGFRAPA